MFWNRFLLTFLLYPNYWYFGIMFGEFKEIKAHGIGLCIGAGSIVSAWK